MVRVAAPDFLLSTSQGGAKVTGSLGDTVSAAEKPNERWAIDLRCVWAGCDGWATFALVADCCSRERWAGTCPVAVNQRRQKRLWNSC